MSYREFPPLQAPETYLDGILKEMEMEKSAGGNPSDYPGPKRSVTPPSGRPVGAPARSRSISVPGLRHHRQLECRRRPHLKTPSFWR